MVAGFVSSYPITLDEKQRITIPAAFRELLRSPDGDAMWLTPHPEGCIQAFRVEDFTKLIEHTKQILSPFNTKYDKLRDSLLSNAALVTCDKVGRVIIPPPLRQFAGLSGEGYCAGAGKVFRIWSKERWQPKSEEAMSTPSLQAAYDQMAELGF